MKPIVYGNVARNFGKKREEDNHTHQWTVYVKPYKNEVKIIPRINMISLLANWHHLIQDMSQYVKKVQFKLHESYANATRSEPIVCCVVRIIGFWKFSC